MKISILVPVYGVEKYIERCAISLFEQTYYDIEYIFVDDCSTDNSIDILFEILDRYPNRKKQVVVIRHDKNMGLGFARNTAVNIASGEFVMHVDSDDYINTDCVRLLVECQQKTGADIVSSGIVKILYNDKWIHINIPDYFSVKEQNIALIRHDIPNNIWGRLIRRKLYLDNKIIVEDVNMSEDLNVVPRLFYFAKTVATVHDNLYYYECGNGSSYTASFSEEKSNQVLKTLDLLTRFFSNKDCEYQKALDYRKMISYLNIVKNCTKKNGHKRYYNKLRALMEDIPNTYVKDLDFPNRIALHIKCYQLFSLYVRLATIVKQQFKSRK